MSCFRPASVSYAGGALYAPQIISNAPTTGKTTLIFSNISDLVANSNQAIGFNVTHNPALYEVGDTYNITYEAFVNTDPRILPAFNASGVAVPASSTGSASASTVSKINAIRITKSEPSREGEILRGVHDNQTIYTLKLRNNNINPTLTTTIDDYLPAGLEYLGCQGDADNTTNAPTNSGSADEYPGSGPIVVGSVANCHAAQSVETVQIDPDGPSGPLADGVYTHVRWATGNLAPGQEITYSYRAAVPLTNNTLNWSGTEPDKFSGDQAANLDNNAANPGNEVQDEQVLTNYAEGAGAYQKTAGGTINATDNTSLTRTAEDLVVYKTNLTSDTLAQGATNTWELRFRTGEYRYSEGIVVTDKPDDEIVNVVNVAGAGFTTKAWDVLDHNMKWKIPGPIAPGATVTLTYTANAVSSASLHTGQTAVNTVGAPKYFGIPEADRTNPWTYREYASNNDSVILAFEFAEISVVKTTTAPGFPDIADAPVEQSFGWRIVVKNNADTARAFDTIVQDTLPPAWTYDAGSTSITGATTAEPAVVTDPAGDQLTWNFSGQTIQPGASVVITFTATPQLAARANPPVQTNDSDAASKDSSGNPGNADGPYTDEDDAHATLKFPIADLVLTKTAPAEVQSNEEFNYTIKVENKGPDTATNVVINDPLPAGLTFVSSADCSSAAVCNIGTLASGASKTVIIRVKATYAVAGTIVVNTAVATQKEWEPTPDDNTDTVETHVLGEANVEITKTAAPTDARPGDIVTYSLKAKNIGTAIANNVVITDSLPVGVSFVSADAPCVEATGTVTCEIGSLNPGEEHTYQVKVKVDPWGSANTAEDHLLDVQKVEAQIDLEAGELKTVSVTCPSGYFASDGSVRIDHVDQGTGDWPTPQVLESRASSLGTWQGTVKNTATGRAQAKIFAVCIKQSTVDGTHSHNLITTAPVTSTSPVLAGQNTATLQCGPGQVAIQPGFISSTPADLIYSQPAGNGWKFILDNHAPATVTFSIRCMTRQVAFASGHTHDLKLERITNDVVVGPGKVNEAQLTCADGSKGIVAGWDLDHGLLSLGNDPRPVTRAYKLYNPTGAPLHARLSLLCLGDRTAGEHLAPQSYINTASVSTTSPESSILNNSSSATVTAEDTDNFTPVPNPPTVKPTPNNPTGQTRLGGLFLKKSGVSTTITCTGACSGTAKLFSLKKLKGKKTAKGSLLASAHYKLKAAGSKKLTLKIKGKKAKRILKKVRVGLIRVSGGSGRSVRIGH
ncbi:MAG: DUF11 domain-containing protein [Thermoleophilia bacterium]|nr:DUF11 domain-containing protein [Thermoleophilia bacterium]